MLIVIPVALITQKTSPPSNGQEKKRQADYLLVSEEVGEVLAGAVSRGAAVRLLFVFLLVCRDFYVIVDLLYAHIVVLPPIAIILNSDESFLGKFGPLNPKLLFDTIIAK